MANNSSRTNIVLVPGFGGFDGLGQLEYYARVTPQFRQWWTSSPNQRAALHYFDNFPTAAVHTRAHRLRQYLAKRIARGDFSPGEKIALVGHSTGGLDIRRLLWDLDEDAGKPDLVYQIDGCAVRPQEILDSIARITFLSVPQHGTNIANWASRLWALCEIAVCEGRLSLVGAQVPLLENVELSVANLLADRNLDLLIAVRDALGEAKVVRSNDATQIALAHEATSELELWLRHILWDFSATNDLLAVAQPSNEPLTESLSPAHFSVATRKKEVEKWQRHRIKVSSYATIGNPPASFDPNERNWTAVMLNPMHLLRSARELFDENTDIAYRQCYSWTASGPFSAERQSTELSCFFQPGKRREITSWTNDGIVNTASMLWPCGEATRLVECDHMDIVGHYKRVPVGDDGKSGRRYLAYDLLKSGSHFNDDAFSRVWHEVFEFCTSELTPDVEDTPLPCPQLVMR